MLARDLAAALDPVMVMEAAGLTPDLWQSQVLRSTSKRMLLLMSRQAGKSTTTAALATHEVIYRPDSLVLLLSPSLRQSSELFKKVMSFYHRVPNAPKPIGDSALRLELANGSRIVSLPSGEDTIRGFSGVRLILIDEAARVPDDLYRAVRPMLAVSAGRLVALTTPWGKRGWFYNAWKSEEPWERFRVTADQCPRISRAFLVEELRALGQVSYEEEYCATFHDATGQFFPAAMVEGMFSDSIKPLFPGSEWARPALSAWEPRLVDDTVKPLFGGGT